MLQAEQIAILDNGRIVYKDHNGQPCKEDDSFSYLIPLTENEELELSKVFREFKDIAGGDR